MRRERRWKAIALLASGMLAGMVLVGTPAGAHVASWAHNWNKHIKPKADKRYERPVIQRGQTVRGTIGTQVQTPSTGEIGVNAQLPRAAPINLDDDHVEIAGVDGSAGECPGTAANPRAAPGFVCIYPYSTTNITPNEGAIWGSPDATKWGFQVSLNKDNAATIAYWFANWAYRAPLGSSPSAVARSADGCAVSGQSGC